MQEKDSNEDGGDPEQPAGDNIDPRWSTHSSTKMIQGREQIRDVEEPRCQHRVSLF